jgi:hypothetical protein
VPAGSNHAALLAEASATGWKPVLRGMSILPIGGYEM